MPRPQPYGDIVSADDLCRNLAQATACLFLDTLHAEHDRLFHAMEGLAARKTGIVVPGTDRHDEVGVMARTVGVIQDNAVMDANAATQQAAAHDAEVAAERSAAMARMAGNEKN